MEKIMEISLGEILTIILTSIGVFVAFVSLIISIIGPLRKNSIIKTWIHLSNFFEIYKSLCLKNKYDEDDNLYIDIFKQGILWRSIQHFKNEIHFKKIESYNSKEYQDEVITNSIKKLRDVLKETKIINIWKSRYFWWKMYIKIKYIQKINFNRFNFVKYDKNLKHYFYNDEIDILKHVSRQSISIIPNWDNLKLFGSCSSSINLENIKNYKEYIRNKKDSIKEIKIKDKEFSINLEFMFPNNEKVIISIFFKRNIIIKILIKKNKDINLDYNDILKMFKNNNLEIKNMIEEVI